MAKKIKKSKESGYVPFTRDDINQSDERNIRAEELFLQMLDIPKKVIKKKNKGKDDTIVDDDFYPTTADEMQRMDAMMEQVEAAIDDRSDREFIDNVAYMKDVLAWSKKRQWTAAWWIIVCVLIVGIYFFVTASNRAEERDVTKNWSEEVTQQQFDAMISGLKSSVDYHEKALVEATESHEIKERTKSLESSQKYLDERLALGADGYKEECLKYDNRRVRRAYVSAIWCIVWVMLYIIAARPYGYMISRRRTEAKIYSGLRKALFGVAGAMVGAAGAMKITETVTRYSDGSKTTNSDAGAVVAMQLMLLVGAAVLVLAVARVVIVIATIMGFIRNYDLVALAKQTMNKGKELTAKKEVA